LHYETKLAFLLPAAFGLALLLPGVSQTDRSRCLKKACGQKHAPRTSTNSEYKGGTISRQTKAVLFASAVLCCATAPDSYATDSVLPTLRLTDGTTMEFTETAPGELVVVAAMPAYNIQ
jgi:hypothetical protein